MVLDIVEGRTEAHLVPPTLLEPLVDHFHPRRVVLFGSSARAEAGPDSDIDLLVIVDDDTPTELLSWRSKFAARAGFHRAVDIVVCRGSVHERKRHVVGTISNAAEREGVVVYER